MPSTSSKNENHKYPKCQKSASYACKACNLTPNDTDAQLTSTWYCGTECQKAHWDEHKAPCKAARARQGLYRAGALAQQIFYRFQKASFMWAPGRIEKNGKIWLIHSRKYAGTSQITSFPYNLFPDVRDLHALLTHQTCNTAMSEMHDIFKVLLRGMFPISMRLEPAQGSSC